MGMDAWSMSDREALGRDAPPGATAEGEFRSSPDYDTEPTAAPREEGRRAVPFAAPPFLYRARRLTLSVILDGAKT